MLDINRLVAQLVEHSLSSWKVVGSFPDWVIPKTLKMGPVAFSLVVQHNGQEQGNMWDFPRGHVTLQMDLNICTVSLCTRDVTIEVRCRAHSLPHNP